MVEAAVTATLAAVAGIYSVVTAVHRRITTVDTRLDRIELDIARNYVNRAEYITDQNKLSEQMVRIENKLDMFIAEFSKR